MFLNILDDKRKEIFAQMWRFPDFSLVGGTALALQIGHRRSVDFDLFRKEELPPDFITKVRRVFGRGRVHPVIQNSDDVSVLIDEVKVSFVYYPFEVFDDFIELERIKLLTPRTISIMKAYTIGRRKAFRDYVDFYFMFSGRHVTLEETIKGAEKIYGNEFNARLFLEQLTYLEDIVEAPVEFLRETITKSEMQWYFERLVSELKWGTP